MQVYKIDKKLFLANELKGWLSTIFITALLYFIFTLFHPLPSDAYFGWIMGIFLLKLSDTLTPYQ